MIPLQADRLLAELNQAKIRFLVVGGFAVSAHGYPRGTKDLDIVPDPDPENLSRLADLLVRLEAELLGTEDLSPDELIQPDLQGLSNGGNFVLATSLGRLDIMQFLTPEFEFSQLLEGSIEETVFGQPVRICGYEDLVTMKRAAGRPEDLIDLERLSEARADN